MPRLNIWEAWSWYGSHERGDRLTEYDIWCRALDLHEAAVAANMHGELSKRPLRFVRHAA